MKNTLAEGLPKGKKLEDFEVWGLAHPSHVNKFFAPSLTNYDQVKIIQHQGRYYLAHLVLNDKINFAYLVLKSDS